VSQVYLKSALVTDLATQVTVRRATADGCAAAPGEEGLAYAVLWGAFFNGGGGTSLDDVQAILQLGHGQGDPPGVMRVGGFLSSRNQTGPAVSAWDKLTWASECSSTWRGTN